LHGAHEDFDLAIEVFDLLIELDVPTVKPAANHHATFHCDSKDSRFMAHRPCFGQEGRLRVVRFTLRAKPSGFSPEIFSLTWG